MTQSGDPTKESRRHFMRQSLRRIARMGMSAAGVDPKGKNRSGAGRKIQPPEMLWLNKSNEMSYARLGRTNLMISRVAMGCASIERSNLDLVRQALDRGVNFLDTSPNYGDSETALGTLFPEAGDRAWICTKSPRFSASKAGRESPESPELSGSDLMAGLEASLARLNVQRIDCYMFQAVRDPEVFAEEALQAFVVKAKEEGKIRYAGLSTYRNVKAVIESASAAGFIDVIMAPVGPLNLSALTPALNLARRKEVGVIGLFTTAGIDASAKIDLYELPEELGTHQLTYLSMLDVAPCAGLLAELDCTEELERILPMPVLDPGFLGIAELDAVAQQELLPRCSVCGRFRAPSPETLEALHVALYENSCAADSIETAPEQREAPKIQSLPPLVCKLCQTAESESDPQSVVKDPDEQTKAPSSIP